MENLCRCGEDGAGVWILCQWCCERGAKEMRDIVERQRTKGHDIMTGAEYFARRRIRRIRLDDVVDTDTIRPSSAPDETMV